MVGGSGYLGRELTREARRRGAHVVATHLRAPPDDALGWRRLDVRDGSTVERLVGELRPRRVVTTAYLHAGRDMDAVNVEGAANVARAAAASRARLVHLSTDVVFDGEAPGLLDEDAPAVPVHDYGRSKLAGERAVAAAHPGALIVRTSLIYGGSEPSDHELAARAAARGEAEGSFFVDELRSPVAVADLAAAILELSELRLTGTLHVAGADALSRYELARRFAAAAGLDPAGIRPGRSGDAGGRRPRNCALDSSRAQALIRTRLRGAREVLAAAAERARSARA